MHRQIFNFLVAAAPATRWFAYKRKLAKWCGISVGNNTKITGGFRVYGRAKVSIGSDCWLGLNTHIYLGHEGSVTIGDSCDIAPEVILHSGSHEIGDSSHRAGAGVSSSICIGDGTWIGTRAIILPGVIIGPGSIVAAGSLVRKAVYPPNSLIAGVPARIRRELP